MRYLKIFFLYFQNVFSHRGRPLIYVLTYVINAIIFLTFMQGVFKTNQHISTWTLSSVTGYYFLLIIAAGTLMMHPEVPIFRDDIERGELAGRLLKPFSYYWQRFNIELPVRAFQGGSGVLIACLLAAFYNTPLTFHLSFTTAFLALIIILLAYFICFTFKIILALTALWTTEIRGVQELTDILVTIFAGYIVPINLLPSLLEKIASVLPFAYIIYYPIIAIQGKLPVSTLFSVIGIQLIWLFALGITFNLLWKKGLMQYSDFGQ